MNIFSLFATAVLAAETILSPLPENISFPIEPIQKPVVTAYQKPSITFGDLLTSWRIQTNGAVLGAETDIPISLSPTPSPSPFPTKTITPTATPIPQLTYKAKKSAITIAVLGDSMVDTLGPDVPNLKDIMGKKYPGVIFTIKNYGVGATNIDYGIERITNGYTYLGNAIPALISIKPDVVVIESFGYNPFSYDDGALDHHWLSLAKAVDTIRANVPGVKIVIAATIAPNANVFGDGAPGLSFGADDKWKRVNIIKKYLENAVKFAQSQHLPLANAYHPSLDGSGNGKLMYINPGDHIHYSDAGRAFVAGKIADAIIGNKLIE